jgi:TonB family protein
MLRLITLIYVLSFISAAFPQDGLVKSFYDNGKLKSEINFSNNVRVGEAKFYYENGNIKEERNYANGKIEGLVKKYNKEGKLKEVFNIENGRRWGPTSLYDSAGVYLTDVNFENGIKVIDTSGDDEQLASDSKPEENNLSENKSAENSVQENSPLSYLPPAETEEDEKTNDDPAYYLTAEVMPEPIGGFDALQNRLFYPSLAKQKKIEGTVKVLVFINKYGNVTKADVVQGIGYGCDESAKTTVFYSRFKPGLIKGKPVNVQMTISLEFQLKN